MPGADTKWTTSGDQLTPGHPLTLKWDNGEGLTFTRTISVDENYMFTVDDAVQNTGSTPLELTPYGLISRSGTPPVSGYSRHRIPLRLSFQTSWTRRPASGVSF